MPNEPRRPLTTVVVIDQYSVVFFPKSASENVTIKNAYASVMGVWFTVQNLSFRKASFQNDYVGLRTAPTSDNYFFIICFLCVVWTEFIWTRRKTKLNVAVKSKILVNWKKQKKQTLFLSFFFSFSRHVNFKIKSKSQKICMPCTRRKLFKKEFSPDDWWHTKTLT